MGEDTKTAPPCAICRGSIEEHGPGKTQHAYSAVEGQLMTHEQRAKQQQGSGGPTVVKLPGAQTNEAGAIGRLVQVLMAKNILTGNDGLYIAGMREVPDPVNEEEEKL